MRDYWKEIETPTGRTDRHSTGSSDGLPPTLSAQQLYAHLLGRTRSIAFGLTVVGIASFATIAWSESALLMFGGGMLILVGALLWKFAPGSAYFAAKNAGGCSAHVAKFGPPTLPGGLRIPGLVRVTLRYRFEEREYTVSTTLFARLFRRKSTEAVLLAIDGRRPTRLLWVQPYPAGATFILPASPPRPIASGPSQQAPLPPQPPLPPGVRLIPAKKKEFASPKLIRGLRITVLCLLPLGLGGLAFLVKPVALAYRGVETAGSLRSGVGHRVTVTTDRNHRKSTSEEYTFSYAYTVDGRVYENEETAAWNGLKQLPPPTDPKATVNGVKSPTLCRVIYLPQHPAWSTVLERDWFRWFGDFFPVWALWGAILFLAPFAIFGRAKD